MANNLHYRHLPASRGGARPTGLSVINTCSPRNLLSSLLWAIGRWEEVGASPSSDDRLCAHVSQLLDPAALPVPSLLWDNLTSTDPDVCGGPWKRVSKVPVRVGCVFSADVVSVIGWCGLSSPWPRAAPPQSIQTLMALNAAPSSTDVHGGWQTFPSFTSWSSSQKRVMCTLAPRMAQTRMWDKDSFRHQQRSSTRSSMW